MSKIYDSILDAIGNTPLVRLRRIGQDTGCEILVKCEYVNAGGSVKDRIGKRMLEEAQKSGRIRPGDTLIEPTSGNTGIALAMMARAYGVEIELVMPDNATAERVQTMEAFGAKVVLVSAKGGMEEAIDYARAKVREGGYVMLDQFSNPDNWTAHVESTGPEIWRDTQGEITHFVSSMGTTGTIMGCSRYLKSQNPAVTIVGCQPTDGSKIPGIRRWPVEYLPKIYEPARVDRVIDISQQDAEDTMRRLALEAGVFVGVSAGGATWAALKVASELESGVVVCILCDRGDRYLSSGVFGANV